jgi:hypothetical protein
MMTSDTLDIIVGCEKTQAVCNELRKLGHNAFSCDTLPCSGGHPEWHLQMDIFEALKLRDWVLGIFFPPCTHLAVSGAAWFEQKRKDGRQQQGIDFFMALQNTDIPYTATENPVGIMSKIYRKPDQIIQPYYFGDEFQKTTCLWLKNLPPLYHNSEVNLFDDNITHVGKGEFIEFESGKRMAKWYALLRRDDARGDIRSKTFPGIAHAMATQWSEYVVNRLKSE